MSARRALDAGMSIWLALLFFIPVVNFLLIIILSIRAVLLPKMNRGVNGKSRMQVIWLGVRPRRSVLRAYLGLD